MSNVPYVDYAILNEDRPLDPNQFPGNLSFTRDLEIQVTSPVTFFVGENGSGKSTLLEAMAVLSRLPISGGGLNESEANYAYAEKSLLANSMNLAFKKQPKDRYFFRAENQTYFASLLDDRRRDPGFGGDPYSRYGGKSLHLMSHGEAFLSIMQNRFDRGLYFLDEPESALSPQRQLTLLAQIYDLVTERECQFFIATHSPILLTYPDSTIYSFDSGFLDTIQLEDTSHFQITSGILGNPKMYWKHLAQPPESK